MRFGSLASFATLFLSVQASLMAQPADSTDRAKPNIVVILVDDMGYGDPKCFNPDSKIDTPHIDALAQAGIRFTDAHAPGPLCHMSRYGLMTGRYPFRTDVSKWPRQALIDDGQMTLASMLHEQGYATSMVGKWHLGFHENGYDKPLPGGPIDCGFDTYFGIRASTDIPPYFYINGDHAVAPPTDQIEARSTEGWSPIQGEFWRAGGIAPGLALKDVLPRFTDEAIKVIKGHKDRGVEQPLFLYLAYPAPHTPWLPSSEFQGGSGAGMYGDFAMMVDAMIGRVLTTLDETGMSDETLVVFTSDNGPVWYEEDVVRFSHDSSGGLRGMKADAWECGHRMPFIVKWPGKVASGSQADQLICFTDLMATFAELLGVTLPAQAGPDSFSFFPAMLGESDSSSRSSWAMKSGSGTMTVRNGDWKLITRLGSGGFSKPKVIKPGPGDPQGQLYNLASDRGETQNLYLQHPDMVKELQRELERITTSPVTRP